MVYEYIIYVYDFIANILFYNYQFILKLFIHPVIINYFQLKKMLTLISCGRVKLSISLYHQFRF